ncbi:hypothetical protein PCANC_22426 [Puccinia coronata f. sp. avenae]|uniref:Uncharacterized protein n=1 Tax=Puccinia coronata f. sp. avenae TaxID=200324 RepID=A0A2N5TL40_9BASI|nr:hypothetical protein PCANC_22426 [Puccinia coronata f. sp. avenae]
MQDSDQSAVSGPDTDSDVEIVELKLPSGAVIKTYRPPQRAKRPLEQPAPRAYPNAKKLRKGSAHPSQPQKRTSIASSTSQGNPRASGSRPHLQQLPSSSGSPHSPDSVTSSNENTRDSPQEQYQIKHNCLASALVALRQLMAALRLVRGRREMASRASPADLNKFVRGGQILLQMIRCTRAGQASTLPLESALPGAANCLEGNDGKDQRLEMVVDGWEYCKLTWNILNDPQSKQKSNFCAKSTPAYVNLFRQRCFDVWNLVEEGCPSLGKKKQNRW